MAPTAGDIIDRILHRPTAGEFFRFCLVGGLNTALDFTAYVVLTRGFDFWGRHIVLAAAASFVLAATSSFMLNTFWTFRAASSGWHRRAPKFFTVAVGGLALNAFILATLTVLGVWDILAKCIATATVLVWNFSLQKRWTFK
jgi:putative flippase GtrA